MTDTQFDIAEIVPRVQRAVEGARMDDWKLSSGEAYNVTADALADILLYCGSIFGSRLLVTGRDANNAPDAYATEQQLEPDEMAVVSAQAALTYFYHAFKDKKMSETIADEASSWGWTKSSQLLVATLKMLQDTRDRALEAIENRTGGTDAYISFLAVRDWTVARYIEPWVYGQTDSGLGVGAGGMESDFRFDPLPTGGGNFL